jgi:DNA mismatch repair protein MutS2
MTKCAIPLKCREYSKIRVFEDLVDIFGDESSILNYMSTFSSHIKKLSSAIKNAHADTVIFIDEIISGTDPEEGAALAISILERLIQKGAKVLVSTHLNKIKDYFYTKEYTQCMSVRFDIENMEPVFGVNYDSINSSYALEIAEKHGIEKDIILLTRDLLGEKTLEKIDFIKELERERQKYFDLNSEMTELKEFLYEKELEIKKRESEIEEKGQKKIQSQLERLKREFDEYRRMAIERLHNVRTKNDVADIFKASSEISKKVRKIKDNITLIPLDEKDIFVGADVYSEDISNHAVIKDIKGKKITVECGNFTVVADKDRLFKPFRKSAKKSKTQVFSNTAKSVSMEINVTGLPFEEAMIEVSKFIDTSYMRNINPVRVIHGRGIIRKHCLEMFKDDKKIVKFEYADYFSGSDGVSVIYFRVS